MTSRLQRGFKRTDRRQRDSLLSSRRQRQQKPSSAGGGYSGVSRLDSVVMLCVSPNGTPIASEFVQRLWEVERLCIRRAIFSEEKARTSSQELTIGIMGDEFEYLVGYVQQYPNDLQELDRLSAYKM